MSEKVGSDQERLWNWISRLTRNQLKMTPFKFRVVLCRIRLFPILISKIKWLLLELPLHLRFFLRNFRSHCNWTFSKLEPLIALNGQNTKLNSFPVSNPDGYNCRIQVLDEPHYSRAGQVYPQLFDCEFDPGSIWYEHNGGKLLKNDMVKMRVFLLAANHTIEQGKKSQKFSKISKFSFLKT